MFTQPKFKFDEKVERDLREFLNNYEKKTGRTFTLNLQDQLTCECLSIGKNKDRTCKWKVSMYDMRKKFMSEQKTSWSFETNEKEIERDLIENEKEVLLEDFFKSLSGVYNSIEEIENKIHELKRTNYIIDAIVVCNRHICYISGGNTGELTDIGSLDPHYD